LFLARHFILIALRRRSFTARRLEVRDFVLPLAIREPFSEAQEMHPASCE
jgi:hypothetical protein